MHHASLKPTSTKCTNRLEANKITQAWVGIDFIISLSFEMTYAVRYTRLRAHYEMTRIDRNVRDK